MMRGAAVLFLEKLWLFNGAYFGCMAIKGGAVMERFKSKGNI